MKAPRILIKLGGAALDTAHTLEVVTEAITSYRQFGYKVILVHGGGPAINNELRKRGISWEFVGGQRVTTPAMIDVIENTLCGNVNRQLVRHFSNQGLPVLGISARLANSFVHPSLTRIGFGRQNRAGEQRLDRLDISYATVAHPSHCSLRSRSWWRILQYQRGLGGHTFSCRTQRRSTCIFN